MTTFRRFLVLQALMLWQGGFLFYATVVVPTGTVVLGAFQQGRVTRIVTDSMNVLGVVTLVILAWDQFPVSSSYRKWRWSLWVFLAMTQAGLFWLHQKAASHVDFAVDGRVIDYPAFYLWHRVYLYVATAQWAIGLVYVALMLRSWTNRATPVPP